MSDLSNLKICFIGAEQVAYVILKGILKSGEIRADNVTVCPPPASNFPQFQEMGVHVSHSNDSAVRGAQLIFLAVEPRLVGVMVGAASGNFRKGQIVVSLAAGLTLESLGLMLPSEVELFRLVLTLPCILPEEALFLAKGPNTSYQAVSLLTRLLSGCGLVQDGPESWIDICTGLSGSGVAFVYLFTEVMAEMAVKMGIPAGLAQRVAAQTLLGTGCMLRNSEDPVATLRNEVCSPDGIGISALHALERGGIRSATISAIEDATQRAREQGKR